MPKKGSEGNKGKSRRSPAMKRYNTEGRGNKMRGARREMTKVSRKINRIDRKSPDFYMSRNELEADLSKLDRMTRHYNRLRHTLNYNRLRHELN